MSELIQKHDNRVTIRWKLLTGASVLALSFAAPSAAKAEDESHPILWLELGGQMEMLQGESTPFTAPFMTALTPTPGPYQGSTFEQTRLRNALGLNGKITFQPEDSDWEFSVGVRYGRTHSKRHVHHQTKIPPYNLTISTFGGYAITFSGVPYILHFQNKPGVAPFTDVKAPFSEKHTVLDFTAGKDVGLGLLGRQGESTLSAGVRSAEFTSAASLDVQARPLVTPIFKPYYFLGVIPKYFTWDQYAMTGHAERSFKGIGPVISWDASAAIAGSPEDGELTLDWGIDVAALFGRQKAKVSHAITENHYNGQHGYPVVYHLPTNAPAYHSTRSRSVTVPELSGFIGLSVRLPHSKISIGYRGDIWFKAMDTGIDARETSNLTFNGPYASISIGLGD